MIQTNTTTKTLEPELRFKEFEEKWEILKLELVSEKIQDGTHFSPKLSDNGNYKYITSKNIRNGYMDLSDISYLEDEAHRSIYKRCDVKFGDILLTKDGSATGAVCLNTLDEEFSLLSSVAMIRTDKVNAINEFVYQCLAGPKGQREILASIAGQAITRITLTKLRNFKFAYPSLPEQKKIASFLSAVDKKIERLTRKKELLTQYKKGVMQQLFSGELRFKQDDGNDFPEWEDRKLSSVLFEHKLKSTGIEDVHSVSVHKGIINQIEHLGRSFSAKDTSHYSRALPSDVIYTKSPTGSFPLGIIKQSHISEDVILSPLYGVFTPETEHLGYMLHVYFESPINTSNYLSSIIQKGAKNTINITNNTFLSKKLRLPVSKAEQKKIAQFLKKSDESISLIQSQITQVQLFKKGLLRKMFV